jgi:hypothetical protein
MEEVQDLTMDVAPEKESNKKQYQTFYRPVRGDDTKHLCVLCKTHIKFSTKKGYTNAMNHLRTHGDYQTLSASLRGLSDDKQQKKLDEYVSLRVSPEATTIYRWLELIVVRDECFSVCEDSFMQRVLSLKAVSRSTIMKYLNLVATKVKEKMASIIPNRFGVIIDGNDICKFSLF